VSDPSGATIGLPLEWLKGSPFSDYLIPGLILSSVLGILPLVVAWGLWKRRSWAWYGSLFVGVSLASWIATEILMIGYQPAPPLQAIYGGLSMVTKRHRGGLDRTMLASHAAMPLRRLPGDMRCHDPV
jgi:hypothetical protein